VARFLFILYFLKQIFLETIKAGGAQKKFGGHFPRMPPRAYRPAFPSVANYQSQNISNKMLLIVEVI